MNRVNFLRVNFVCANFRAHQFLRIRLIFNVERNTSLVLKGTKIREVFEASGILELETFEKVSKGSALFGNK